MKLKKWITPLIAIILSSVIALSGIHCLLSGFWIEPEDWTHIVCMTVFISIISALCLHFRLGELVLTLAALLSITLAVRCGDLLISLEKLLNHITTYYDYGYGCGVLRWSDESLKYVDPDTALILLAALPTMAVCWVIQRKQWFGFGVIPAIIPLAACCVVTDTIPNDTSLWLLLTALLLLTLTQRLRRISMDDANRLTALLLVPVIAFSGLIFRFSSGDAYLDQAQAIQEKLLDAATWLAGFGILPDGNGPIALGKPNVADSVDLSAVGSVNLGDEQVMTVTVTNINGVLYLRGRAYDSYTGLQWDATVSSGENGWPNGIMSRQGQITIKTTEPLLMQYFPYYINVPSWKDRMTNGYYPNPDGLLTYSFNVNVHGDQTKVSQLPSDVKEQYLALPSDTHKAAREILKNAGIDTNQDAQQLASAISDYVRRSAEYNTTTQRLPAGEEDFAIWFLTEGETGYCVHFASAAAVLMRAAGVPARYVTGYMTNVSAGSECAVLSNQSHAWVEYYHPDKGWTVLEATPVTLEDPVIITPPTTEPPETTVPTETTRPTETTVPTLPTQTAPTQPTGTTRPTQPTENTQSTQPSATTPATTEPVQVQTTPTEPTEQLRLRDQLNLKWIRGILRVLAVWLILAAQYKLRILLRKRRMRKGSPNQQALCRWRHVRRISWISGLSAQDILPLAEKAAFSQHDLEQEELDQFDDWFRRANRALLQKPWVIQFLLRLIFAVE